MSNKIFALFTWVLFTISSLLALVFIFIEGRMLFTLDWLVYDNQILGFFKVFSKLLLALILLATSVLQIVNIFLKKEQLAAILYFANLGLVAGSIILCVYGANYAGEILLAITLLIVLLKTAEGIVIAFIKKFEEAK